MSRPILVGIGEALWDMLPGGKQLGGAPANFAYHANALGGRGVVASRVGDDEPGRELLSLLASSGLETRHIQIDPGHPTGWVDVRLDAAGVPEYVIHENVAWDDLRIETPLLELARQADCVGFGTLAQRSPESRATIQALLGDTRPDCLRVFDINLRQDYFSRELIHDSLSISKVLKLNDAELPVVAALLKLGAQGDDALRSLIDRYGLSLVALTRGAKGSVLYASDGTISEHLGIAAHVVDTVGAGDAFTAALALGLLNDLPLDQINQHANQVAAYVCSQAGAMPQMPQSLRVPEPGNNPEPGV
jgi:fructokinase